MDLRENSKRAAPGYKNSLYITGLFVRINQIVWDIYMAVHPWHIVGAQLVFAVGIIVLF